jgi:hypothetical protein
MPRPGEPDRLAGRGEPAFPGQPAGQRQRGDRPDPVQPRGQRFRPGQVPGRVGQLVPQQVELGFQGLGHLQGDGDLQLPGRGQMGGRGRPQRGHALPGAQRPLGQGRGALVEQHRVDPLHPGGMLAAQIMVGLQQRPALQDPGGRDRHSGSRPSASSIRRCRPSVLSVLACRFLPRRAEVPAGSARCASTPAAAGSSRHPAHPSTANATSSRPLNRASQARRCARSAGLTCPRHTCPVSVSRSILTRV